ncbi:splicing regulator RBM11 [Ammospiza nelsoni]|uniref:splicing regulator RBM11 n=1 Tax=Ammospiza nelsoni TaxID=2857394 RepID=UPI0028699962|nr:splicing regulator RBM11 [Ammospiza nelsoni]
MVVIIEQGESIHKLSADCSPAAFRNFGIRIDTDVCLSGCLCLFYSSMSSLVGAEAAEQTLLVGNLESRVQEEILYELFLQAGPLTKVMICEDKEGKPQSFGYVCFKHKVSVPYAKALLDGICLYGRPITVQYWRGNSPSPQLDSCTDGFEHHIDLESPADRHQELSGSHPFPLTPLPVNNSLLHDHPGFQEVNQTAQFKTARSYPEFATFK